MFITDLILNLTFASNSNNPIDDAWAIIIINNSIYKLYCPSFFRKKMKLYNCIKYSSWGGYFERGILHWGETQHYL